MYGFQWEPKIHRNFYSIFSSGQGHNKIVMIFELYLYFHTLRGDTCGDFRGEEDANLYGK